MKSFLKVQSDILKQNDIKARRWDKSIIKTCLTLYSRSPQTFQDLKDTNICVLPSGRLLQKYKKYCTTKCWDKCRGVPLDV